MDDYRATYNFWSNIVYGEVNMLSIFHLYLLSGVKNKEVKDGLPIDLQEETA